MEFVHRWWFPVTLIQSVIRPKTGPYENKQTNIDTLYSSSETTCNQRENLAAHIQKPQDVGYYTLEQHEPKQSLVSLMCPTHTIELRLSSPPSKKC